MATNPNITWVDAQPMYQGQALSSIQLNALSDAQGTFAYSPPIGTVLSLGLHTLTGIFLPTNPSAFNSVSVTIQVRVLPALKQLVAHPLQGFIPYGSLLNLTVTAYYSDGTTADQTNAVVFQSVLNSFVNNTYHADNLGEDTITISLGTFSTVITSYVVPIDFVPGDVQKLSYWTQKMLNYYDVKDQRVRINRASIDAQLLNIPSQMLEDLKLRVDREQGRDLHSTPNNIDNRGLYYNAPFPLSIDIDPSDPFVTMVEGTVNGNQVILTKFDDRLPIPGGVSIDDSRSSFTTDGSPIASFGPGDIASVVPDALPYPNTLSLWATVGFKNIANVDISIEGYTYPQSPWPDKRNKTSEHLTISGSGLFVTSKRWVTVTKITARNIPDGMTVDVYTHPFGLPSIDNQRPYIDWNSRDRLYDRYWKIQNSYVLEGYMSDYGGDLEYVQAYSNTYPIVALAVEPNTYGLLAITSNSLLYMDRREPMPDNLLLSGQTSEPAYGLNVDYDFTKGLSARFVTLNPLPMTAGSNVIQYRYRLVTPKGLSYSLTDTGSLSPLTLSSGWIAGTPVPMTIPLQESGTYVFTIECIDSSLGNTSDSRPFLTPALFPIAGVSLAGITATPKGILYDSWGDCWIWDGTTAIPVTIDVYSYILDPTNNKIYFTYNVQDVSIE